MNESDGLILPAAAVVLHVGRESDDNDGDIENLGSEQGAKAEHRGDQDVGVDIGGGPDYRQILLQAPLRPVAGGHGARLTVVVGCEQRQARHCHHGGRFRPGEHLNAMASFRQFEAYRYGRIQISGIAQRAEQDVHRTAAGAGRPR